MRHDPAAPATRWRRSVWAMIAFLVGFAALLTVIARYFLLPAADAARDADVVGRRQISAFSVLLLAILLLMLVVGLLLTFRVRRFFAPRPDSKRTTTEHIDAWAESARRFKDSPNSEE